MVIHQIGSFKTMLIFFWKGNSIRKFCFIFYLNWIEHDNIIALSIHKEFSENSMIFYHFYFKIDNWNYQAMALFRKREEYCDKILSIERAAPKSWLEYTTNELKSEKLIK